MDDTAGQVVHSCVEAVHSLVGSLLQGDVALGDLQTCLKHREQFKKLFQQCENHQSLLFLHSVFNNLTHPVLYINEIFRRFKYKRDAKLIRTPKLIFSVCLFSSCLQTVLINMSCIVFSTDKSNAKSEKVAVSADEVLAQREKDLNTFVQRKQQIEALIKMIAKVTESITGELNVVHFIILNIFAVWWFNGFFTLTWFLCQ